MEKTTFKRIDPVRLKIERHGSMRTHGIVYANHEIEKALEHDKALDQVANVACLPGIVGPSMAMPDIHWGYGFPIGGVAAFSVQDGIISPGGVGYDINCGIRCIRTGLDKQEVTTSMKRLLPEIFRLIPTGVGAKNKDFALSSSKFKKVLETGAAWTIKQGYSPDDDLEAIEDLGTVTGADPSRVSARAIERGLPQLGSLGSGNHFIELDYVDRISDPETARAFGVHEGQVLILVHTGSRGLGHQICDDYVHEMLKASARYGIELPDRQLACAPVTSSQGEDYLSAMACAANFAFANREIITFLIRKAFERTFGRSEEALEMGLLFDCCHNIAKIEKISGEKLCIHRKGATRALPPGDRRLPPRFIRTGQPIIVPGDMGRMSFILSGAENAEETFYSACHGAGRLLSRRQARKISKGKSVDLELRDKGIEAMAASRATLAEEIPDAYKNVSDVVETITSAKVAKTVARLRPIGIIKG